MWEAFYAAKHNKRGNSIFLYLVLEPVCMFLAAIKQAKAIKPGISFSFIKYAISM